MSPPSVRPIEPERNDGSHGTVGLGDVYGPLEDERSLGRAKAMRPTGDGGLHIAEELRRAMPWMDGALGLIERSCR